MRLFITEKPSVARDLARALGARGKHKTHIEGPNVWISWCLGHLVEPAPPDAIDPAWKRWSAATLPMLPQQLKLQPIKRTRGHLRALVKLLRDRRIEEVVNACDAGREGELIFRYVYEHSGCKRPILRFWVSSLTQQAIKRALAQLQPGQRFDDLAAAARCRAEADWLVGMNATRALTIKGGALLSVGRVQTPTLAMVVRREEAIEAFRPEDYWEVWATLSAEAGTWRARWVGVDPTKAASKDTPKDQKEVEESEVRGRLSSAALAESLAGYLQGREGRVIKAARSRQEVPPPQLHHLTSLQRLANRRFGLTADATLKAAQALYERHKLITYPRTDSRHLSRDVTKTLPAVLKALKAPPYGPLITPAQGQAISKLNRRFVDDSKVGDHHALLPTPKAPKLGALSKDEARVYDLIVRRTLAMLYPPAVYAKTVLVAEVGGEALEARGRVRLDPGWEVVEPPAKQKEEAPELPKVEEGDPCQVDKLDVSQHTTKPPPRYSEATLLGAMERAGRELEDEAQRAAMREGGLGTPATRAATLETLLRRGYMQRSGRTLSPTLAGRALVNAVVEALRSPALTGDWEARLGQIADGRQAAMPFRVDIRDFTRKIVGEMLNGPPLHIPASLKQRGKKGRRGRGKQALSSSESRRAASTSWRGGASAPTPQARPPQPPKPQHIGAPLSKRPIPCPRCKNGEILTGRRGWGCSRWREGCALVVPFERDGITLPPEEAKRLLRQGKTRLFAERGGHKVKLILDVEAEGCARWAKRGEG